MDLEGQAWPIEGKGASHSKQMVFAYFDLCSLIYTHITHRSTTINGLGHHLCPLQPQNLPELAQDIHDVWLFHWDNAPVHTAAVVSSWFVAHDVQRLEHPPFSPDLAPADFFLFRKVKEGLGGQSLDQDSTKNAWKEITGTLTTIDFVAAFRS